MADLTFLDGGGEMGAYLRAHDWGATSLGPPENWPQGLRTAVRLLLNTGHPMYIFWGPDGACLYNDAYSLSIGPERHPGSIGRPAREIWDEIWHIIGPQIAQVMAGKGATWHENQLVPITRRGRREEVYWTYSYGPIDDGGAPNGVGGVLVVCTETTAQVLNEQRLETELERQRSLLQQMPGFVAVLNGPDHVFSYVNEAASRLGGARRFLGRTLREAFPDLEGQGFFELLDRVYVSGERFAAGPIPANLEGETAQRFIDLLCEPIRNAAGTVTGVFVGGYDVTEHERTRSRQRLLIEELNHRVKNTLATVQSIVAQTFRARALPARAREDVEERLMALARAHDLLTQENWEGADIADVVAQAVTPFASSGAGGFDISGPSLRLTPHRALAIAMALQELTTNAVKYGALSHPEGRVCIRWSLHPSADEPDETVRVLRLNWIETGGPPVVPPTRRGFGLRLLQQGLSHELDGRATVTFGPAGLECEIVSHLTTIGSGSPPAALIPNPDPV
ncbi:sensor histidine kinase [Phenylobacterium sp.]|uniref:sensor histidine kinase n=1 Tax=Phenylobacterium sp. TaxID=1871053 RepID=UPI002F40F8F1